VEGPFGLMPRRRDVTWEGLDFDSEIFYRLMQVDRTAASAEAEDQKELFERFGLHLPKELELQRELLVERLARAPEVWTVKDQPTAA
jgi:phosphoenolpyruvate carboxykinase (GTP)